MALIMVVTLFDIISIPTPSSLSRFHHIYQGIKVGKMRVVIQRVRRASVTVVNEDTSTTLVSEIGKGLVCLVGVREGDGREHAEWMCKQVVGAKLFEGMSDANADKRWRSSAKQNGFEILLVSQARCTFSPATLDDWCCAC